MHTHHLPKLLLALAALTAPASAQAFNIDLGDDNSLFTPTAAYGAAAGQPGTWNGISSANGTPQALVDLSGAPTAVTLAYVGGLGDFGINNPNWFGDDKRLMADAFDAATGSITFTIAGLQAGAYEVYTYALAPDFPDVYRTRVAVTNGAPGPVIVGGAWLGSPHVEGVSYAKHTVTLSAGQTLQITTSNPGTPAGNLATANGFQIKPVGGGGGGPLGTPFCFGDGTGTACPCGNTSGFGANEGCLNSLGTAGKLVASGTASLAGDTATLLGSGMPNANALYFQGTAQQNIGLGTVFGDGLRCAAGTVVRLGVKVNAAGASQYPEAGDQTISVRGQLLGPGTRTYQVWYRNAAAFCTASTFNLTNGVELTWTP